MRLLDGGHGWVAKVEYVLRIRVAAAWEATSAVRAEWARRLLDAR